MFVDSPSPPVVQKSAHLVSISGLRKEYANGARILEDLALQVEPGQFVTLLGSSGCGKSTLLKMIAGLTSITAGSVTIEGRTPELARDKVSFVFQDATLLPWRNVRRNVGLLLEFDSSTKAERLARSNAALELVGLKSVADLYPRQLSGGMKMRVSIARALTTTPRLLLMDEPFGALDEMTRNRLNEELLSLRARQGWTVIFVTHSIPEAVFLSDRVLLMAGSPGRIVEDIPIPLSAPRTEALRADADFLRLVGKVSRAFAQIH